MRKILILLLSVTFVLTPLSTSLASVETISVIENEEVENLAVKEKIVLLQKNANESIYLFENVNNEFTIELSDNTEAFILTDETAIEKGEITNQVDTKGFTFIEVVVEDQDGGAEILQGFVEDRFIYTLEEAELALKERAKSNEPSIDLEEKDEKEIHIVQEKQDKFEQVNESEKQNEVKSTVQDDVSEENETKESKDETGVSVTTSQQVILAAQPQAVKSFEGLALKNPVDVYDSDNRNARVLKTYKYGSLLKYRNYSKNWYAATVYIKGKQHTGYIHKSDVSETRPNNSVYGEALKNKTTVYSGESKSSKVLKSYQKGRILKYKAHNKNWHSATVINNGKAIQGYIHVNDVETGKSNPKTLRGYGLNNPTKIYKHATTNSSTLKSYRLGSNLKYKEFTSNWYEATVYINGKAQKGYVSKNHVGSKAPSINGYAQKSPTAVYSGKSKNSKVLKSYVVGSKLKYRAHDSNWYSASVKVNGNFQTGYIHKNDVGLKAPSVSGYATKNPSRVYASTSRSATVLKSYVKGSKIKYQRHNNSWFKARVKVGGKYQTGYFHKNDVNTKAPSIKGYASKNSTKVYTSTNRNSKVIKSYKKASNLKVRYYNSSWYQATVYVNGKAQRGYIHKNDFTTKKLSKVDKLTTIDNNNQLILVTSKGYHTRRVNIETYDRGKDGLWKRNLSTTGHIGINGFARNKREGDGKSPTGKYTIGDAFAQHPNPGTKLNFRRITSNDVWVDDPKSSLYNTWQKRSKTKHLWNSAENMNHRLYKYGFVINYNTKREPYKGSAIFFHVGNSYTVGCTATSQTNVISMLKWLDPSKKPVIIQTPESELNKY